MLSLSVRGWTGEIYYDCQMFAPERLCLECIEGAVEYGADAANYAEVTGFTSETSGARGSRVTGVRVKDRATGETHAIKGKVTVNAAGPWADEMMRLGENGNPSRGLIRSKGIHIITREISGKNALAIQSDIGGHFFVIPWRGHTIIGTTDAVFKDEPDRVGVTEEDIRDFLSVVNDGLPGLNLKREDVLHFYVGIRPLIDQDPNGMGPKDSYKASREAEVCDHEELSGIDGFIRRSAANGRPRAISTRRTMRTTSPIAVPNVLPQVLASASILAATAILAESGLAFLGLGDPNRMSWGAMIGAGREAVRSAYYLILIPGAAVLATVLAFHLIGDGLTSLSRPRSRY